MLVSFTSITVSIHALVRRATLREVCNLGLIVVSIHALVRRATREVIYEQVSP